MTKVELRVCLKINIKMTREKNIETCLVLATALVIFYCFNGAIYMLYGAIVFGVIGLFFDTIAGWITKAWYKLAEMMGFVMSKVLLSIVFFAVLFPIAMLYRLFNKDSLQLKRSDDTYWVKRAHTFTKKDLENTW